MAIEETTAVAVAGAGGVNGLKALSLTSVPAIATSVNVAGAILVASGIVAIGTPLVVLGVRYYKKKAGITEDPSRAKSSPTMNGKVIMSMAVASTLMISVGTAMMPRTQTVMVIHIITGYACLIISFIHVYQYRAVIKGQAKKFFRFLNAPKTAAEPARKTA